MARDRKWQGKKYLEYRDWVRNYKLDRGCMDCGYRKHASALEFDHRAGEKKEFIIAGGSTRSKDAVLAEIRKCDVVCANCHRIRTFERKNFPGRPKGSTDKARLEKLKNAEEVTRMMRRTAAKKAKESIKIARERWEEEQHARRSRPDLWSQEEAPIKPETEESRIDRLRAAWEISKSVQ